MKEPTVQDIAQLARVSLGTVSNVLNGRPSVKEELALRVVEAAAKARLSSLDSGRFAPDARDDNWRS